MTIAITDKGRHRMPFGAELREDGSVHFRLWAPDVRQVELSLEDGGAARDLRMSETDDGWHELQTTEASAGGRYRYRIDGGPPVPDPASRFQPAGVHGPSEVIDPAAYRWRNDWQGRRWEEAVVYELHIGTFTRPGTFASAIERLPYLADLGITAIEVMPVAAFAGERNWGYDGVLLYAPHAAYGRPDDFRAFVDAAHGHGIMVLLDVVYNHFGPEGNYLRRYATPFFTERHKTPWGEAINFDGRGSRYVREYFIQNALYWLKEFRLDGLRLDAVHAIIDESREDIVTELSTTVQEGPGRQRHIHVLLENHDNEAHYLKDPVSGLPGCAAQWNDDFHHACHVLLTGESDGYYVDYAERPIALLARCLSEGFAFQGERSGYLENAPRGEPSGDLPLTSFISFLQNHDQVGNRAFGERLTALAPAPALRAMTSIMLLSPSVPALFMGEEFGCRQPFLFFADFEGELAEAVRAGRKREFEPFARFGDELPDPMSIETFRKSVLQWDVLAETEHADWLRFYRELLDLRRRRVVPGLPAATQSVPELFGDTGLLVTWRLVDGTHLSLVANLGDAPLEITTAEQPKEPILHAQPPEIGTALPDELPAWSAVWLMGT